jgi:hypothetical protein
MPEGPAFVQALTRLTTVHWGGTFRNDMLHIALATVADVDVLVSWNFRNVVRLEKIRLFNTVNLERGYKPIEIYSPREVTTHDSDERQSG